MEILIEAAKETPIYLQVMFVVLMGLRRSKIIGVKYSDIDYINRTLHVERQLGKVPMSKKEDFKPKTYTKQEIDVYGDKQEIIEDCLEALEPFINEVLPEEDEEFNLSVIDYMDSVALELVI